MANKYELENIKRCKTSFVLAINDTINVLHGKWKLPILGVLIFGKMRFKEIEKSLPKITPRMLSKELKDLEMSGIIKRTVYDSLPVLVEYELTKSGVSFKKVLEVMIEWGIDHRKKVFGKQ